MRIFLRLLVACVGVVVWSVVKLQLQGGFVEAGIIAAVTIWAFNAVNLQAKASIPIGKDVQAAEMVGNEILDNALPEPKSRIDKSYSLQRLFARLIDYQISALVLGGLILYTKLVPDVVIDTLSDQKAPQLWSLGVWGFFSAAQWTVLETLLLFTLKTTPGKSLLGLSLTSADSQPNYWKRSFGVWAVGMGFGLPFISLFASLIAGNRMKRSGMADWDRWTHFKVEPKTKSLELDMGVAIAIVLIALISVNRIVFLSASSHSKLTVSTIQSMIRNADINKLSEHPAFVDAYHNETEKAYDTEVRLYQARDVLVKKAGNRGFADMLIKTGLPSILNKSDIYQSNMQENKTAPDNQIAISVQEEIEKIPALSYWQKNSPEIFQKCIEIDNQLKANPNTANLSLAERFTKVADAAIRIYGNPIENNSEGNIQMKDGLQSLHR